MNTIVKNGLDLNLEEELQIKESLFTEFKVNLPNDQKLSKTLFFLLKEESKILSIGGLLKTEPVFYNDKKFTAYGIVNVISNVKGKGYGKKVVTKMREYLISNNLTGIGFCHPKNQGFYKKCGFIFTTNSTQRFVYLKGTERITNQDGQIIFYEDSSDNFMKKVLLDPEKEVLIPSADLW